MKRREFLSCAAAVSAAAYAGQVAAGATAGEQAKSGRYDFVLKNGRILDGAGNPWFKADIALKNGRINTPERCKNAQNGIALLHSAGLPKYAWNIFPRASRFALKAEFRQAHGKRTVLRDIIQR